MKIVWAAPPNLVYDQTPHYFQALFSAAAVYLRQRFPEAQVVTEAAGFHGGVERVILRHFACAQPARYLVLWSRPWEAQAARRVALAVKRIAPQVRVLVWGEAGLFLPQYFQREPFDLCQLSGDPELVIADAIEALERGQAPPHGVVYRDGEHWRETGPGQILSPEEWAFPDLAALDGDVYRYWRKQRGHKRDDLSFAISRGCPLNCARWCPTPLKEGLKDRRRSARATVEYMETLPEPYGIFQMHSPLFSWDREWLTEFIDLRRRSQARTPFKVVDLMNPYAEERLVAELAEVGLSNVGFGVESLTRSGKSMNPKVDVGLLEKVAANLQRYGVSSKAYVQLGLPGQTREDIFYTLQRLLDLGLKPRPTGSTPFWKLRGMTVEDLDLLDLSQWDRKTYYEPRSGLSYAEFLRLIHEPAATVRELGGLGWAA